VLSHVSSGSGEPIDERQHESSKSWLIPDRLASARICPYHLRLISKRLCNTSTKGANCKVSESSWMVIQPSCSATIREDFEEEAREN